MCLVLLCNGIGMAQWAMVRSIFNLVSFYSILFILHNNSFFLLSFIDYFNSERTRVGAICEEDLRGGKGREETQERCYQLQY